jgi:hypothetical protein
MRLWEVEISWINPYRLNKKQSLAPDDKSRRTLMLADHVARRIAKPDADQSNRDLTE